MRTKTTVTIAAVLMMLLAPLALAEGPLLMLPRNGDPDVPSSTAPIAIETPFAAEKWSFTEGVRTRTIAVPAEAWDRVVLVLTIDPATDPWDRLFVVGIDGTEVFHGTTPRAPATLRRDITEYASLLMPGAEIPVQLAFGTWVGFQRLTLSIEFYDDPATAGLVAPARDLVLSPFFYRGLGASGSRISADVEFPAAPAASGVIELTTSGHGQAGEFFFLEPSTPPTFRVFVDGEEIAHATALPYIYALAGVGSSSVVMHAVHGAIWWGGQQALDIGGVHTGTGEIPSYRAELGADTLAKLTGSRHVEVIVDGGAGGYWPTSLSFLLDGA